MEFNEMNEELHDRIWAGALKDVSTTEFLVLLCLGVFTSTKTGRCNLAQSTIADKTRMSRRGVIYAINGLEVKGYIVRQQEYSADGGKAPCNYIVNTDRLPQL